MKGAQFVRDRTVSKEFYPVPYPYFQCSYAMTKEFYTSRLWRCAQQQRMTILDLPDNILIDIAQHVSLPQNMELLHRTFRILKLAEYQSVWYCGNNTMSIRRVFNQKRRHIGIKAPRYQELRASLLNEFNSNALLTSIDIGGNRIGKKMALQLVEVFKQKQIVFVGLSRCNLDVESAKAVANYIAVSSSLTSIDLTDNNLTSFGKEMSGVQAIANAICVRALLTECNLHENFLGDIGWCIIFDALCDSPQNKICKWDLNVECVNPVIAKSLETYLANSASLTSIDLTYNNLGSDGAEAIARAISVSASLTCINLCENQICSIGANAIADAISVSALLTKIDLSHNQLCGLDENGNGTYTAEGIKAIALAISVNASLTSINLCNNHLGNEGRKHIAKGIAVKASLAHNPVCYSH